MDEGHSQGGDDAAKAQAAEACGKAVTIHQILTLRVRKKPEQGDA